MTQFCNTFLHYSKRYLLELRLLYKNLEFEAYLRFNTKQRQKKGTLHDQLIPLEHKTLGTLDVNPMENGLVSHLHLLVILHFKEGLQLTDEAGYVASRSRSAPFVVDLFEGDVAALDLCTFLHPVVPTCDGVGLVPFSELDEVK